MLLIQHLYVESGRFAGGKRIHLSAQRIDLTGNLRRRPATRALEKHVFEEMGEPFLPPLFIAGTDIHPNADRDGL